MSERETSQKASQVGVHIRGKLVEMIQRALMSVLIPSEEEIDFFEKKQDIEQWISNVKHDAKTINEEFIKICSTIEALVIRLRLSEERNYHQAVVFYSKVVEDEGLLDTLRSIVEKTNKICIILGKAIEHFSNKMELIAQLIDVEGAYNNEVTVIYLKEQHNKLLKYCETLKDLRNVFTRVKEQAQQLLNDLRRLVRGGYYW